MLKRHIFVRLRLLCFLCILCVSIFSMRFAVSASSADPVSAVPTLEPAEPAPALVTEEPLPLLRAASGGISTPYVSIFSYVRMFTGDKNNTSAYTKFTSQPFYASILNSYSSPISGITKLDQCVLFYDSLSFSGPCDYFRLHFTLENGLVTFKPRPSVVAFLYFVSDQGFGVKCQMSYSESTGDFYCKVPSSYFASDGYFYLEVNGSFSQYDISCQSYDRFTNLSVNDFIIPTTVLPDTLTDSALKDWTYVDRSKCRDFPDSTPSPSASSAPDGGGTGGGGSTPATSDPALGEIKDSINSQKEQDKQQHEETKGLLGRIIDGITSIPGKIIELLTDALKALFIPSDDFLNTKLKSFQDDLDNMGFLAWPVSASIDFLEMLLNSSGSSGEITLPAAKFNMDGKTITIWEETTFNFADLKSGVPVLFDTLNILFGLLMLVLVCQRAYNMWGKYFGQEPADVFSAIDVGDITD